MMNIEFNEKIVKEILNRKEYLNEAVLLLEGLMDEELQKPEGDMDFDFINDCSSVLIEIQSGAGADYNRIIPFLNSKEFASRAKKRKHFSRTAKIILVAAIIFTSSITANAAIGGITGKSLVDRIISAVSAEPPAVIADNVEKQETTTAPVEKTQQVDVPEQPSIPETAEPVAEIVMTEKNYGASVKFTEPDTGSAVTSTTEKTSDRHKADKETTQAPEAVSKETTTAKAVVVYKLDLVVVKNHFKNIYEIGESFDTSGLYLIAYYSDGTAKTLNENDYTVNGFDSSTPGIKKVELKYEGKSCKINVTVAEPMSDTATESTTEETEPTLNEDTKDD